ncbi:3-oxoacyl-[acyl-carrier-protein] synthase III C-terminal domain-containing protein [Sphingobium sp. AN641]|uniref:3-oxoacyl-[acyl-carrier-protein] synthase III C-terminal domain-containing protein n=1 Tax=Sphingobium sp. AN641 TaxID=3133443 RepID=UPI0030C2F7AD
MADFGIKRFGGYVPRLRIERSHIAEAHKWMAPGLRGQAKGSRAFLSWDEDAVTMAVEAARDCLNGGGAGGIEAIHLASTSLPYADLQHASLVASALGLPREISSSDAGHSQRAGTSGLLQALKVGENALFIASDAPVAKPASTQELSYGAGSAAFLLGSGDDVAAKLIGAGSVTAPFVDHFRAARSRYDYFWEERWVRDEGYAKLAPAAIAQALAKAGIAASDITHFVMPSMQRGAADAVAKKIGFAGKPADGLENGVGYAGAAHALLMLANVLETAKAGDRILLVGFGQGADALVFEVTGAIEGARPRRGIAAAIADGIATDSYLRMLSFYDGIDLEWGMRSEKVAKTALTEQYRSSDQIDGLVAGKCGKCATIQFPQLEYCVNPECNAPASQFEDYSLVDAPSQVLTYTADWLSYHPAPPLYVGFVQFDNGARILMEIVDVGPEGLEVGTPLKLSYRIKERDRARDYNRYFWKASPTGQAGA